MMELPPSLTRLFNQSTPSEQQLAAMAALRSLGSSLAKTVLRIVPNGAMREEGFLHLEKAFGCFLQGASGQHRVILTPDVLLGVDARVEEERGAPSLRIYMNAVTYADLRKYGRDRLDIESRAEKLKKGLQAYLHGREIWTTRAVPDGFAVFISEKDEEKDLVPGWTPAVDLLVAL